MLPDCTIDVVAARDIGEEEEVTISYVDPEKSTFQRRRILRDTHGECVCDDLLRFIQFNMYRHVLYGIHTYTHRHTHAHTHKNMSEQARKETNPTER